jgi:hypothetical protein
MEYAIKKKIYIYIYIYIYIKLDANLHGHMKELEKKLQERDADKGTIGNHSMAKLRN